MGGKNRMFADDEDMEDTPQTLDAHTTFNMASITRLARRANVTHIGVVHQGVSDIIYTQLHGLLCTALVMRDDRGAQIVSEDDVAEAIRRTGIEPLVVDEKPDKHS